MQVLHSVDGSVPGPRGAAARRPAGQLPPALPPEVPDPTHPDEVFDRYARLVTTALGVPVGLVSLVSAEGQVFPGAVGLPSPWQQTRSTGLSHSFCQHVVANDAPLVITDARQDPRLADNLAVDDIGVLAYAGFPLHGADGTAVGSLCAIDTQPREWTQRELAVLADLAATAASELLLRRARTQGAASEATAQAATSRTAEVMESMAVGYLSMDPDWRITYVNAEGRRVLGATGREIVGEVIWDLYPATVGTEYEANYRAAAETGTTVTFDAYYPAPLDAWFELRATPEVGPSGTGVALYFLDITARRAAQEAAELAGRRLAAVGGVALALASAEDVSALVTTMAEQGLRALGADGGAVAVPDPLDPDHLWSYITTSYGEGVQADYGHLALDAPLPVCEAYTSGRRLLLPDAEAASAYSAAMADVVLSTGCRAWACIPLRAGGQVVGVLTAGWEVPQGFEAEQLDLLDTLASQCAQALQRLAAREAQQVATHDANRSAAAAALAAGRQSTLVGIARALGVADSEEQVLAVVAAQGVQLLDANGCGLCLLEPDGAQVRTLVTDSYSDVRPQVRLVPADFPLPAVHSAATGTPHFLEDREQTEARFPGSTAIYTATSVEASAAVPMTVRGRLLGCLSVGFAEARTWTTGERETLEAFAALTAQTLERIASHDAERAASAEVARFSETLQRSLLTAPPEPDHLQVAVRYSPAATEAYVGGDWYDAYITSGGVTSLVIGDVTGHDSRAAAAMGQYRNLLRGIGYTVGAPPAAVLSALDRAVHDLGVRALATVVLAEVEQTPQQAAALGGAGLRTLRWSNAGHPAPLLISADGTARYLDTDPDLLLGLDPDARRADHTAVLAPGDSVLLYTDGLVERRGVDLRRGAGLAGGRCRRAGAPAAGGAVRRAAGPVGSDLEDDVAMLAVRAHPEDEPRPAEAGPGHVPGEEPVVSSEAGTSSEDPVDRR